MRANAGILSVCTSIQINGRCNWCRIIEISVTSVARFRSAGIFVAWIARCACNTAGVIVTMTSFALSHIPIQSCNISSVKICRSRIGDTGLVHCNCCMTLRARRTCSSTTEVASVALAAIAHLQMIACYEQSVKTGRRWIANSSLVNSYCWMAICGCAANLCSSAVKICIVTLLAAFQSFVLDRYTVEILRRLITMRCV